MSEQVAARGQWSSKWTFIMAATGSAVGLGNIWKFPYITAENGGGAFVLLYLACVVLITLPVMVGEVMLGHLGKRNPVHAMVDLARASGGSVYWAMIGILGVIAGVLILSYYSVIAGWTMAYVGYAASGTFEGAGVAAVTALFDQLLNSPQTLLFWHTLFCGATIFVVARGVEAGLEKAISVLMPGLFLLLGGLLIYAVTTPAFAEGAAFLLQPDFSKLTSRSVLAALGQAFFTLSLGMGAIMVYGSYLPAGVSVGRVSFIVAIADTLVALMAGLVIFPLVFTYGLEPAQGPGLIFLTLPNAFAQIPGGQWVGGAFFLLLLFAAWSSAISLIEPAVSWLVERFGWSRARAAMLAGGISWLIGLLTVVSFNLAADFKPLANMTLFDLIDFVTSNILLPLGGMLMALFVGWRLKASMREQATADLPSWVYTIWLWSVRVVAPVAVLVVMVNAIVTSLG